MKVLHFNASTKGGAAIAALRIFDAVKPFVPNMWFYTLNAPKSDRYRTMPAFTPENGSQSIWTRAKWSLFYRELGKATAGKLALYEKFTPAKLPIKTPLPLENGMPDLVHMHWTSEMIDYPSFFASLPVNVPIVWTCHDMNPFTGGCHYTWGCDKFASKCHQCPQLALPGNNDLSAQTQLAKATAIAGKQLHVVANSHWIEGEARKSMLFGKATSIQTIHYPIDTALFKPLPKQAAKEILGIGNNTKVISFGAERFDNERKGFRLLNMALEQVYKAMPETECLVFGAGNGQEQQHTLPPMRYTGFVESPLLQRIIYSASDVFVIPSQQEAFGQTALEALACGTAVVGFDAGGIADIVKPNINGLLAPNGDTHALAQAITHILTDDIARHEMEANARQYAINHFEATQQGHLYAKLYEKALAMAKS